MIKSKIKIEDGAIYDFYDKWGFKYLEGDKRLAPDEKGCESTSYAEEPGEHIDPRTVDAPFDSTARFLVEAPNRDLGNVNRKIAAFISAVRGTAHGDVKYKKEISFYDLRNRVKITGYPEVIAVPTEVYRSRTIGQMDFAVVELTIHVADPRKCDFKLNLENF